MAALMGHCDHGGLRLDADIDIDAFLVLELESDMAKRASLCLGMLLIGVSLSI